MRALAAAVMIGVAACGGGASSGNVDGGAGATCDVNIASDCKHGLVCCAPCRGIPYPPDFGPILGSCSAKCPVELCP